MAKDHIKRWQADGWSIEKTNGGHLKLKHPLATETVFAGSTPSDHRAALNTDAQLRRTLRNAGVTTTAKGKTVVVEERKLKARRPPMPQQRLISNAAFVEAGFANVFKQRPEAEVDRPSPEPVVEQKGHVLQTTLEYALAVADIPEGEREPLVAVAEPVPEPVVAAPPEISSPRNAKPKKASLRERKAFLKEMERRAGELGTTLADLISTRPSRQTRAPKVQEAAAPVVPVRAPVAKASVPGRPLSIRVTDGLPFWQRRALERRVSRKTTVD